MVRRMSGRRPQWNYDWARLYYSPDGTTADLYCERCHTFLRKYPRTPVMVIDLMDDYDKHTCGDNSEQP